MAKLGRRAILRGWWAKALKGSNPFFGIDYYTVGISWGDVMTTKAKIEKKLRFKVPIVVKKDDIGYHAFSPPLRGLHVDGDSKEEALKVGIEGAKQHLECMIEHGDMIPLSLINNEDVARVYLLENSDTYHIEDIEVKY